MPRSHRPAFKGCCAMCASAKGRVRGQGHAQRATHQELRTIGRTRRVNRREIPDDQRPLTPGTPA